MPFIMLFRRSCYNVAVNYGNHEIHKTVLFSRVKSADATRRTPLSVDRSAVLVQYPPTKTKSAADRACTHDFTTEERIEKSAEHRYCIIIVINCSNICVLYDSIHSFPHVTSEYCTRQAQFSTPLQLLRFTIRKLSDYAHARVLFWNFARSTRHRALQYNNARSFVEESSEAARV